MIVNILLVNSYDDVIQVTLLKSLVPCDLLKFSDGGLPKSSEIIDNKNDSQ